MLLRHNVDKNNGYYLTPPCMVRKMSLCIWICIMFLFIRKGSWYMHFKLSNILRYEGTYIRPSTKYGQLSYSLNKLHTSYENTASPYHFDLWFSYWWHSFNTKIRLFQGPHRILRYHTHTLASWICITYLVNPFKGNTAFL